MVLRAAAEWDDLADAYAFAGNSFLAPMTQTSDAGLVPDFWRAMPDFGDEAVAAALAALVAYAEDASRTDDAVMDVSVEYTHLFIGPPEPAVVPWETYYRNEGAASGFGSATFCMQEALRSTGMAVDGPGNQYADHIGIELLYLSELCRRAAGKAGEGAAAHSAPAESAAVSSPVVAAGEAAEFFAAGQLGTWVGRLAANIQAECPDGYYALLAAYVCAIVAWQAGSSR